MGLKRSYAIPVLLLAIVITLGSCTGEHRSRQLFVVDPADTVTPGTWDTAFIRDYNYVEGRIFDLFYPDESIGPYDRVAISIFEEETRSDNTEAKEVYLKTTTSWPGPYDSADVLMREITGDYGWEILYAQDTTRSPVAIHFYASKRRALGVYMVVTHMNAAGDSLDVTVIGHKASGMGYDTMDTLRVLQPLSKDMFPSNPAWSLMWRNCYRVPQAVQTDAIDLRIFKALPGREGVVSNLDYQQFDDVAEDPYIRILGLDQVNNSKIDLRYPDGKLDPFTTIHRDDWGLVIFPEREPFRSTRTFTYDFGRSSDRLRDTIGTIYDYSSRSEKLQDSKYYLQVRTFQPDYVH